MQHDYSIPEVNTRSCIILVVCIIVVYFFDIFNKEEGFYSLCNQPSLPLIPMNYLCVQTWLLFLL